MFKKLVNTARGGILSALRSAEKNIADDSNFTSSNAFNIARYYIPFMPTPTKTFNVKEYEKRVIMHVNSSNYTDDEKKSIIREISQLTHSLPMSGSVKLYRFMDDLSGTNDTDTHLFAGMISRAVVLTAVTTLITSEPGFFVMPIGFIGFIYFFGKLDGLTDNSNDRLVRKHTSTVNDILSRNTVQNSTIRLEKEFGLIRTRQASLEASTENWDRLRYWEKQTDEDAVVIYPKNTYDDGK